MARSKMAKIDDQLKLRIIPVLYEWGLERCPNDAAEFGRYENGYLYQFSDTRDKNNIKFCNVHIFQKDLSIILEGKKGINLEQINKKTVNLSYNVFKDSFVLTKPINIFSLIKNKFDLSFRLTQRKNETIESAISQLISSVLQEIPRLKSYLYDTM